MAKIMCWNCGSDQINRMPEGYLRCDTCYTEWMPKLWKIRGPLTAKTARDDLEEYANEVVSLWTERNTILEQPRLWPPNWIAW